jgi:16S rRNA processing protein RimM
VTASAPSSRSSTDDRDVDAGLWACGTLGRAHGLSGELYLDLLPGGIDYLERGREFLLSEKGGDRPRPVRLRRTGGTDRRPLVRLEGIDDRDAAIAVQGAVVFASAPELDEGGFFAVSELVGLRAVTGERELGVVSDVTVSPAHDILVIRSDEGGEVMVPFVGELVDVDAEAGIVRVREGLLE